VHVVTPVCVIVAFVEPLGYVTVIDPARAPTSGFAVVVNAIAALATPDVCDVIVSHAASADAFQLQPDPVTTSAALDAPPSAGTVCDAFANA
jgi:hypothetical protein